MPSRNIKKKFTYHEPKEGQPEKYKKIRRQAMDFACLVSLICPASGERQNSIKKIEEAVFWANAAIARHEKQENLK